jgi:hypothetical protein
MRGAIRFTKASAGILVAAFLAAERGARCPTAGVVERHGGQRPFVPEPWRWMGPPRGRLHPRRGLASGGVGCPCPEPGPHGRGHDTPPGVVQRTGRGHDLVARSQRRTAMRRCPRHARDEGPSIRGWGRHGWWRPRRERPRGHATDGPPRRR